MVQWGNPPPVCVYGPIFVAIAAAVVSATSTLGTAAALGGLRAISSAALIACALLAYAAYRGGRRERLTAAATIALNPAAIWCAAEGHNDALALAIVLAGTALARRGHPQIGAFLSACAGAVKLPALAGTLPAAFAGGGLGAVAGVVAVLAVSVPLFTGIATRMAPHAQYAPQASFQALLEPIARAVVPSAAIAEGVAWAVAVSAAAVLGVGGTSPVAPRRIARAGCISHSPAGCCFRIRIRGTASGWQRSLRSLPARAPPRCCSP